MTTEFNDGQHYGFFMTGTTLTSGTGKYLRQSELTLAALRATGALDNMVDGTSPPATDKFWLDKNTDPAVLKEWDSIGSAWVPMTFDRLFGRAVTTELAISGGSANAIVVTQPALFIQNRLYTITPSAANTGAVTIQVAGVGTYNAVYTDGSALSGGEFAAGITEMMIFRNGRFEVLFPTAGFATSARTISAGSGLTGGGNLSADRTIALSTSSIASLAKADSALQPEALISETSHVLSWGTKTSSVWDGVSDFQAAYFQNQATFVPNGSLGAIFGQRLNTYTGGAASDAAAPASAAVRGYNQIATTVTYCNELGGLFVTDNLSWLGQGSGIFGQANSVHGGRAWGVLGEAKELPEVYTATAGQTVFVVPNGFNAIGAVTRNGSSVAYTPSSPNVTLTVAASAGDIVKIYRANPQNAFMGAEIGVYGAAGTDTANALSGNRVALGVFSYRSDFSLRGGPAVRIGTGINIVADPADSTLTVDRGINFQGRFKHAIDLTASNLTVTDYLMKYSTGGAGIDKDMNMSLGSSAPTAIAGYTTLVVANLTNGGLIRATDGTAIARVAGSVAGGVIFGAETNHDMILMANASERWRVLTTGPLRPSVDNSYSLGTASFRASVIYAGTGTINTSDARLKTDIRDLSDAEKRAAARCRDLVKAYRFIDAVAEKGDAARIHFGVIAQEVEAAFVEEGLDAWRYGVMCSDPIMAIRKKTVTRSVQKCETVTKEEPYIDVVDGIAYQAIRSVDVVEQVWENIPLLDADGNPVMSDILAPVDVPVTVTDPETGEIRTFIATKTTKVGEEQATHKVPVMVDQEFSEDEEYDTGETRLGVRYTELLCFMMAV